MGTLTINTNFVRNIFHVLKELTWRRHTVSSVSNQKHNNHMVLLSAGILPHGLRTHKAEICLYIYARTSSGYCSKCFLYVVWIQSTSCLFISDSNPKYVVSVAANIMNKQCGTAEKGWFSSLGVGLEAKKSHRKKKSYFTEFYTGPRNWTDTLERPRQRKVDVSFWTWEFRNLYRAGALEKIVSEMTVQGVRWDECGSQSADDCIFFYRNGNANNHKGTGFFIH